MNVAARPPVIGGWRNGLLSFEIVHCRLTKPQRMFGVYIMRGRNACCDAWRFQKPVFEYVAPATGVKIELFSHKE